MYLETLTDERLRYYVNGCLNEDETVRPEIMMHAEMIFKHQRVSFFVIERLIFEEAARRWSKGE